MAGVRVLTDSTACLPVATPDGEPAIVSLTVAEDGGKATTSQPSPDEFRRAYQGLLDDGADEIVAVMLSAELSGTANAATATAKSMSAPVRVVDTRTSAMALGFAALAAVEAANEGKSAEQVAERARLVAKSSHLRLITDSLDDLRRGGRLSAGRAGFGGALGARPIIGVVDGKLQVEQRARTRAAARAKIVSLTIADLLKMNRPALAVHYVGDPARAEEIAHELFERTAVRAVVTPLSPVLAAHTGPETVAIVVADLAPSGSDNSGG